MQATNQVPVGSPTVLMMIHPLRYLPLAHQHATICSAGSKGYCATKEMLQSGAPGHTLLIESGDIRDVESSEGQCCLVYVPNIDEQQYKDHMPKTAESLTLYSDCVCLPPSLLGGCSRLTMLDLSPLSQVTCVQESFLQGCSVLTTLDLSPLSQVTEVRESFLGGCSGLTTLDLSPLSQVTVLRGSFLQGCSGLTTLDLSPLSQITVVEWFFLAGCSGLTTLDLSPLTQVTAVDWSFLRGCSGLTTLDLSPLSQVLAVQGAFLEGCNNLDAVDNPPMCCPPSGWYVDVCSISGSSKWVRGRGPSRVPTRE